MCRGKPPFRLQIGTLLNSGILVGTVKYPLRRSKIHEGYCNLWEKTISYIQTTTWCPITGRLTQKLVAKSAFNCEFVYRSLTIGSRYIATSPANFKKGDIVELQLTVTAVRVKNDQVRMLIKLRALTLLNSEFTEVSLFLKIIYNNYPTHD